MILVGFVEIQIAHRVLSIEGKNSWRHFSGVWLKSKQSEVCFLILAKEQPFGLFSIDFQ